MFSYGSGLASSLFSCKFVDGQKLSEIADKMDIGAKLESRIAVRLRTLLQKLPHMFYSGFFVSLNVFHVEQERYLTGRNLRVSEFLCAWVCIQSMTLF